MSIENQLTAMTQFLPLNRLREKIALPSQILHEPLTSVIPSIVLGSDGLALRGIILFTANLLCDVRIAAGKEAFDIIPKSSVRNYRFSIFEHEVKDGETVKAAFQVAEITLIHNVHSLGTTLSYAGSERDQWVMQVLEAIPVATML